MSLASKLTVMCDVLTEMADQETDQKRKEQLTDFAVTAQVAASALLRQGTERLATIEQITQLISDKLDHMSQHLNVHSNRR